MELNFVVSCCNFTWQISSVSPTWVEVFPVVAGRAAVHHMCGGLAAEPNPCDVHRIPHEAAPVSTDHMFLQAQVLQTMNVLMIKTWTNQRGSSLNSTCFQSRCSVRLL